jgi:hypothetical protein
MPRVRTNKALERNAPDDLWKHTLSRIPTLYGRLAYLASLRDPNSGAYRHHGLSTMFGREQSVQALRGSHEKAFNEWLNLSLEEQNRDLRDYVAALEDPLGVIVNNWLNSRIYRTQMPDSARKMERELFCRDLEALLETIRNAPDAGEPAPRSSRSA